MVALAEDSSKYVRSWAGPDSAGHPCAKGCHPELGCEANFAEIYGN